MTETSSSHAKRFHTPLVLQELRALAPSRHTVFQGGARESARGQETTVGFTENSRGCSAPGHPELKEAYKSLFHHSLRARIRSSQPPMTAEGQANADSRVAVPFRQTLRPLVIAPAGALAVIACFFVQNAGPSVVIILLVATPIVYGIELVFVVPILWLWPASRRPRLAVGALWGAAASWGFLLLLVAAAWYEPAPSSQPLLHVTPEVTLRQLRGLAALMAPGIASGVLFSYVSRKH
jgi:hypothetical protein